MRESFLVQFILGHRTWKLNIIPICEGSSVKNNQEFAVDTKAKPVIFVYRMKCSQWIYVYVDQLNFSQLKRSLILLTIRVFVYPFCYYTHRFIYSLFPNVLLICCIFVLALFKRLSFRGVCWLDWCYRIFLFGWRERYEN